MSSNVTIDMTPRTATLRREIAHGVAFVYVAEPSQLLVSVQGQPKPMDLGLGGPESGFLVSAVLDQEVVIMDVVAAPQRKA